MLGEMAKVKAMMRELYGEINACRGKSADGADGARGRHGARGPWTCGWPAA